MHTPRPRCICKLNSLLHTCLLPLTGQLPLHCTGLAATKEPPVPSKPLLNLQRSLLNFEKHCTTFERHCSPSKSRWPTSGRYFTTVTSRCPTVGNSMLYPQKSLFHDPRPPGDGRVELIWTAPAPPLVADLPRLASLPSDITGSRLKLQKNGSEDGSSHQH